MILSTFIWLCVLTAIVSAFVGGWALGMSRPIIRRGITLEVLRGDGYQLMGGDDLNLYHICEDNGGYTIWPFSLQIKDRNGTTHYAKFRVKLVSYKKKILPQRQ